MKFHHVAGLSISRGRAACGRPSAPARTFAVKAAFTLIELLVVVAIITVLIALLIPSLNNARELAKTVRCDASNKGIGIGFFTYASEYSNNVVPSYAAFAAPGEPGYPGHTWFSLLNYLGMVKAPTVPLYTSTAAGSSPPTKANSIFICPNALTDILGQYADPTLSGTPAYLLQPLNGKDPLGQRVTRGPCQYYTSATGFVDCSYGANEYTGQGSTPGGDFTAAIMRDLPNDDVYTHGTYDQCLAGGDYRNAKMSQISQPATAVLLFDGIAFNLQTDAFRINARHKFQTQTNILFADGHAQTMLYKDLPQSFSTTNLKKYVNTTTWLLTQ